MYKYDKSILKPGMMFTDGEFTFQIIRKECDRWLILSMNAGRTHVSDCTGLLKHFTITEDCVVDLVLEKYK